MHGNVPVRFGRGRLDSLGNKGLAAYLITSLSGAANGDRTRRSRNAGCSDKRPGEETLKLVPFVRHTDALSDVAKEMATRHCPQDVVGHERDSGVWVSVSEEAITPVKEPFHAPFRMCS